MLYKKFEIIRPIRPYDPALMVFKEYGFVKSIGEKKKEHPKLWVFFLDVEKYNTYFFKHSLFH